MQLVHELGGARAVQSQLQQWLVGVGLVDKPPHPQKNDMKRGVPVFPPNDIYLGVAGNASRVCTGSAQRVLSRAVRVICVRACHSTC